VAAHDDPRFVGGHPLAGAETGGVRFARADLFDGAAWYLTPTADRYLSAFPYLGTPHDGFDTPSS